LYFSLINNVSLRFIGHFVILACLGTVRKIIQFQVLIGEKNSAK